MPDGREGIRRQRKGARNNSKNGACVTGPPKAKRRRIAGGNNPFPYKAIGGFIVRVYTIIPIFQKQFRALVYYRMKILRRALYYG
jgi:hypothetical protein